MIIIKTHYNMIRSTFMLYACVSLLSLGLLTSCSKDDDAIETPPDQTLELSDEEVAEIVEASMTKSNGRMVQEIESTTEEVESITFNGDQTATLIINGETYLIDLG
jgi:uncharacterized lipoprotein YajG